MILILSLGAWNLILCIEYYCPCFTHESTEAWKEVCMLLPVVYQSHENPGNIVLGLRPSVLII